MPDVAADADDLVLCLPMLRKKTTAPPVDIVRARDERCRRLLKLNEGAQFYMLSFGSVWL